MKKLLKIYMKISLLVCIYFLSFSRSYAQQWDTVSVVKNTNIEVKRVTNKNLCQSDTMGISNNNYNINKDHIIPCLYNVTFVIQWGPDAYGNMNAIPSNLMVSLWDGTMQVAQVPVVNNQAKFVDIPGNVSYDIKITAPTLPVYNTLDAALMFNMANGSIQQTFYKMRALDVDWNGYHDGVDKVLLANTLTHNLPAIVEPYELLDPVDGPVNYYDTYQLSLWHNDDREKTVYILVRGYIRY